MLKANWAVLLILVVVGASLFVVSQSSAQSNDSLNDWSIQNHDAANTCYTSSPGPQETPDFLWTYPPGWLEAPTWVSASAPVTADGRLFFSSADYYGNYTLHAVNASTGRELWTKPYGLDIKSQETAVSPAVKDGIVYTCSYAYNTSTGAKLLDYSAQDTVRVVGSVQPSNSFNSPIIVENTLFLTYPGPLLFSGGGVIAIDLNNDSLKWSFSTNGSVARVPAVANGVVYFSAYDGKVYALDATTGIEIWERAIAQSNYVPMDSSLTVADGKVFIGAPVISVQNGGKFFCLDARTGGIIWTYPISNPKCSTAFNNGLVYFTSGDAVYALKAGTGEKVWNMTFTPVYQPDSNPQTSSPLTIAGSTVYVAANIGTLYGLDSSNGNQIWNYTFFAGMESLFTSPVVSNGVIYTVVDQALLALGKSPYNLQPTSTPQPQPWRIQNIDSTKVGYISMVLDSKNTPHLAYVEFTGKQSNQIKYATWSGTGWTIQTVDNIGSGGGYCSLALDSKGLPHLSYYDSEPGCLKYASLNGSKWSIEVVDTNGVGQASSLAIDANDNPHISYCNNYGTSLKYAVKTGASWSFQTVDQNVDVMWYTTIGLDSSGYPHIAYFDNLFNNVKYASLVGTQWRVETVVHAGGPLSMALDSNGTPYIVYHNNYALNYATKTGNRWDVENIDSGGSISGCRISVVVDSEGNPQVSYTNMGSLLYARYNGSSWFKQSIGSQSGLVGVYSSIVLDFNGSPHIAYSAFSEDSSKGWLCYAALSNDSAVTTEHISGQALTIGLSVTALFIVVAVAAFLVRKRRKPSV
jgi:outer membrane protein assembly factor BamB